MEDVTVIGAGLAGSEAAWQIAGRGVPVKLWEMRPRQMTPAHHTANFAELVCSNSFRANRLENAVGLLKEEMRHLGSLIMSCADSHSLPAGGALAVDREPFAQAVTKRIKDHALIEVIGEEAQQIPKKGITVVAAGPLASTALTKSLSALTGGEFLYFYDAAAPIVDGNSIDYTKAFWASRYGKGTADYLNCPLSKEEYERFYEALISAEVHEPHPFEKEIYFEGCMPVEVMASRGINTLLFGPLKPVGLIPPGAARKPYAVVQLRRDNAAGTLFNMVGFQTSLKWSEQKRVFSLIPGLEQAEFVRCGVMHRNTFVNAPRLLRDTTQFKTFPNILLAGQISGVEGYVESAASGLISGINAARLALGKEPAVPPRNSALGSLLHYISHAAEDSFQPMNVTFGLLPAWPERVKDKKKKNLMIAERAINALKAWRDGVEGGNP